MMMLPRSAQVAESGVAAHWAYKDGRKRNDIKDIKQFRWMRELLDIVAHLRTLR